MAIEQQARNAKQLFESGRTAEAVEAYRRLLQIDANHLDALNVVGFSLLAQGNAPAAIALFERAAQSHRDDVLTRHHLGLARRAAGDDTGALSAFDEVLRLSPDVFVSRLQRAEIYERLDRKGEALRDYFAAMRDAQMRGHWRNRQTTPPSLQSLVEHGMHFVNEGRRQLFEETLVPLRAKFGADSLQRVEQCLRIFVGEMEPHYVDDRQRPRLMYFPGLPTSPYFDRRLFPWAEALESRSDEIRSELATILPGESGSEAVFQTDELARENLRGASPKWNGYYFYRHGRRREENASRCSRTAQAIELAPLMHVRGLGPEVMFSVLAPDTHLLPHHGVTNARVVVHLPLIVPRECALRVGGEIHEWCEGRLVFFDDTFLHEAWNRSDRTRVVLIIDCWNPHLTDAERAASAELMVSIAAFDRQAATA